MSNLRKVLCTSAIVTRQRGSWRWQDAYGISTYAIRRNRAGKLQWYCNNSRGKWSWPQLQRNGIINKHCGSLHHKPITANDITMLRDKARKVLSAEREARAYRLALRLISGLNAIV